MSVIITTLGGVSTTLTSPPGGGVTVLDAALSSSNGTEITGIEGSPTPATAPSAVGPLLGTFTDANTGATADDFTGVNPGGSIVVNWGDGSALETLTAANITPASPTPVGLGVFSVNAPHTYAEEGTYAFTVTVTDDGGAVTIFSGSAIIADAALAASAVQPTVSTTEGGSGGEAGLYPVPVFGLPAFIGAVGSFTDGNPTAPVSDFTATIDWGDGTLPSAGTISQPGGVGTAIIVSGAHTYADAGVNGRRRNLPDPGVRRRRGWFQVDPLQYRHRRRPGDRPYRAAQSGHRQRRVQYRRHHQRQAAGLLRQVRSTLARFSVRNGLSAAASPCRSARWRPAATARGTSCPPCRWLTVTT